MNLLLATAPWPVLVRIVATRPGPWTIWGSVPAAVEQSFASDGHQLLALPLPRPLHHHALPREVASEPWRTIVVPAMGHLLPTRWPLVRHLASTERPIVVSDGDSWEWIHHADIPPTDAYTWALDRLNEPSPEPPSAPDRELVCVRADFLGDVVLTLPALEAVARQRPVTVLVRDHVAAWVTGASSAKLDVRPLEIDGWQGPPVLPSAGEVADLSRPRSTWPLSAALSHATAAQRRVAVAHAPEVTPSESLAETFGVTLSFTVAPGPTTPLGVLCPCGSTTERDMSPEAWQRVTRIAGERLGVTEWVVVGAPAPAAAAIAALVPNCRPAPFAMPPREFLTLVRGARSLVGVSSAFSHLAALQGIETLVIEHPHLRPDADRLPIETAAYVRPSSPWWRPLPASIDVARSTESWSDSYGFGPDELETSVEDAAGRLATTRTVGTR